MADTGTVEELAENFDFSDERVRENRTAVYAELRKGPPRWSDAYGGHWVVSRYSDLKEMLGNIEMVGNDLEMRGRIAAPTLKISRMTVAGD